LTVNEADLCVFAYQVFGQMSDFSRPFVTLTAIFILEINEDVGGVAARAPHYLPFPVLFFEN